MSTRIDGRMRADAITDVERPWVELVEQLGERAVRDILITLDISPATAAGLAMWLGDQALFVRHTSRTTVRAYRRALEDAGDPPSPGELRSVPAIRAIPGYRDSGKRPFARRLRNPRFDSPAAWVRPKVA